LLAEQLRNQADLLKRIDTDFSKRLDGIQVRLDDNYVTRAEFKPVQTLVYGGTSAILLAVVGALVALVLK
jgi:hypothetical protein